VRQATGELADRLHLLRLPQGLFGYSQCLSLLLLCGDVPPAGVDQVSFGSRNPGEPTNAAIYVAVSILKRKKLLRACLAKRAGAGFVVGDDKFEHVSPDHFVGCPAKYIRECRVHGPQDPRGITDELNILRSAPETVKFLRPCCDLLLERFAKLTLGDDLVAGFDHRAKVTVDSAAWSVYRRERKRKGRFL